MADHLSKDDIVEALTGLSVELGRSGDSHELLITGGAALVLLYNARESTKDVDAVVSVEAVRIAARNVASQLDLPEDWLNDSAKGFLHGIARGEIVFQTPALVVRALAPPQLLAMKLGAWRDDLDIEDARLLFGSRLNLMWCQDASSRVITRSKISGRASMQIRTLIEALMSFDVLRARQWVADAMHIPISWSEVDRPADMDAEQLAVAAGVVELLAERSGQQSPSWTVEVGESPKRIYLVRAAQSMPRLRQLCEEEGPEPLRKRQIMAPPEFLTVA